MTPAIIERIVSSDATIKQLAQQLRAEGLPVARDTIAAVRREHRPPRTRRYNEETILRIHSSIESDATMARKLREEGIKISREMVRHIRAGTVYSDLKPKQPAVQPSRSCIHCIHWRGSEAASPCDLGHRDPIEEGPMFGKICCTYRKNPG